MAYDLPTCKECQELVYEGHKTGKAHLKKAASGRTFPRLSIMPPPCHECPKLRMDDRRTNATPDKATEATDRQHQALYYYRLMKHDRSGMMPYDGLTLQNNVLIAQAEEEARVVNATPPVVVLGSK